MFDELILENNLDRTVRINNSNIANISALNNGNIIATVFVKAKSQLNGIVTTDGANQIAI